MSQTTMVGVFRSIASWFDNHVGQADGEATGVDWARVASFVFLHAGCLLVLVVGFSWFAFWAAIGLYLLRAFFITGFYHRYFSHRAYKTSRATQLALAVLGNTAIQRGPLWWAAHHRHHHRVSDRPGDPHSPHAHSFLWSHMGWLVARENYPTRLKQVPDLARYPELRWLDRFDTVVPLLFAAALFGVGALLKTVAPQLGTSGPQLLVWGLFVSTTILFHVTSLVNSGAHTFGRQRYKTPDQSRNSLTIAMLTLGEGWHNNHHKYPGAVRQGFFWWEIDITFYALKALSWCGLIWDLHAVPERLLRGEDAIGD